MPCNASHTEQKPAFLAAIFAAGPYPCRNELQQYGKRRQQRAHCTHCTLLRRAESREWFAPAETEFCRFNSGPPAQSRHFPERDRLRRLLQYVRCSVVTPFYTEKPTRTSLTVTPSYSVDKYQYLSTHDSGYVTYVVPNSSFFIWLLRDLLNLRAQESLRDFQVLVYRYLRARFCFSGHLVAWRCSESEALQ